MKLTRYISLVLVFSLLLTTVGCGKDDESGGRVKRKDIEVAIGSEIDNEGEISHPSSISAEKMSPIYENMTKQSVWSTGNNYRLKKVLEKLRNGEKVNVVALGGSITEGQGATNWGDGYAYRFVQKLRQKYGDNIYFKNAGICGTPSSLGIMRYERDVLCQNGYDNPIVPDLLIIEFAVNDFNEVTVGRAYESIISRTLLENEDCAIIMLFSLSDKGLTLEDDMRLLGDYYDIPMVSMKSAYNTGAITHDEYFTDELHPADGGHELMANCLMELLKEVDAEETDDKDNPLSIAPLKGRNFSYMTMIDESADVEGLTVSWGSFNATDYDIQMLHNADGTTYYSFPKNYMNDGTGNEPLVIKATCSKMLLTYKTDDSDICGTVEVYVDGNYFAPLSGQMTGQHNMCYTILVLDSEEYIEHTLEIKMADDSVGKCFTIYGIAFDYKKYE